jgi:hypothetical protein
MRRADSVDVALDLVVGAAFGARFAVGEIGAVDGDDVALFILVAAGAFDHEAVAQTHLVAGEETEVALARYFHEVVGFDPQFLGDRARAHAGECCLTFLTMFNK